MHLILTHEQADFDALAALTAARLLDGKAVAALPVNVNRNVRAFLTLYGAELPLTLWHDLPRKPVTRATLVDTQTMPSVHGLTAETAVQVIDHHPRRPNLPAHWQVHIEPLGAITTFFVEEIRRCGLRLSPIQATLLLLGIYEDTGNLTYESTTPRDVFAAGFLLEGGASLETANAFLNPPLTPQQRILYDILLANTEVRTIKGSAIAVAHAPIEGLSDEIAAVAHKLHLTLETDALFALVSVPAGVQMVARATGDRVDLPGIMAQFGGGGHKGAAAALVKGQTLDEVRAALWRILPQFVRPPLTVGEIMSRRPQVLSPQTTAREAAELMRKFGYEGYPVVENGRVVGLLTRRAVDRALSHDLNLPASAIMQAGDVTVRPQDSVEHLQQVMTDTGWGQVPVVDDKGKIIGIVTRTDLIKALAPKPRLPSLHNLAAQLEASLPPARLALLRAAAHHAEKLGFALYIVGGFVRDLLLSRPSIDFDLVVEGNAIALARSLSKSFGGRVVAHRKFGTAKWQIAAIREELASALRPYLPPGKAGSSIKAEDLPAALDLVTARTEFYTHPTALPTVAHASIKLDLHRRDFTINTLALRLDGRHYGELHDYWGGLQDLREGVIRVLHSLSFVDDPTRMLRAVRFEQRFGFRIEERTLQLLHEARELLAKVSGDRIRHELDAMLEEERGVAMLRRLAQLGLLAAIHPALPWDEETERRMERLWRVWPPDAAERPFAAAWSGLEGAVRGTPLRRAVAYAAWLMALSEEESRAVAARLGFSRPLAAVVGGASRLYDLREELRAAQPSEFTFTAEKHPLAAAYALRLACADPALLERLDKFAAAWRQIKPITTGNDLRARGLRPGPRYKQILQALRAAWLDGKVRSEEEEQELLEELIGEA